MMMLEGGTVKTDEVRTVEKLTEDCGLWSDADAALNPRPHRTHTHTRARAHTHPSTRRYPHAPNNRRKPAGRTET